MNRLRIAFFGTSDFAVPILEALAASPYRPEIVVTTPDRPAGRGLAEAAPPVKRAAERLGIAVIQPPDLKIENWPIVKISYADLFVVAAYGKILPASLLSIPKSGALNIHPSLLPRWRGASPIQSSILNGDTETGVTIIQMDADMDHGPVVRSSKFEILNPKITAPELESDLSKLGARLIVQTIPDWLAGRVTPEPQDHAAATFTRILKREDGEIDWAKPAVEIERMIRAFKPWPGGYTFWQHAGNRLRLVVEEADVCSEDSSGGPPGRVSESGDSMIVATGSGDIALCRVKPEGGRSMDAASFLRGRSEIIGTTLG